MSGKCRPSLRGKTLYKVEHSNLSQTDKNCIKAVFDKFEEQQAEIEKLKRSLKNAESMLELKEQEYGGYGEAFEFKPSSKDSPVIHLSGTEKKFDATL